MHSLASLLDEPEIRDAALPLTVVQDHRLSDEGIVPEWTELLQVRRPGRAGYGEKLAVSAADALLQTDLLPAPPLSIEQLFG